jgi:hypothetical protein
VAPLVAETLRHGRLETHHHLDHFGPMVAPAEVAASIDRFVAGLHA